VIILSGSLVLLARPRLFAIIESSKSVEAILAIMTVHKSIERCFHFHVAQDIARCDEFTKIDVENPGNAPGAIFSYGIFTEQADNPNLNYRIRATRNDPGVADGRPLEPDADNWIDFSYNKDGSVVKNGSGFYAGFNDK